MQNRDITYNMIACVRQYRLLTEDWSSACTFRKATTVFRSVSLSFPSTGSSTLKAVGLMTSSMLISAILPLGTALCARTVSTHWTKASLRRISSLSNRHTSPVCSFRSVLSLDNSVLLSSCIRSISVSNFVMALLAVSCSSFWSFKRCCSSVTNLFSRAISVLSSSVSLLTASVIVFSACMALAFHFSN